MKKLEGKVALVTGAAMGLGLADAKMLAEEGARVLLTDIDEDRVRTEAEAIGENARSIKLDVSNPDDWNLAIKKVEEFFGGLDILVNNAGIVIVADPENCTLEDFRKTNSIMNDFNRRRNILTRSPFINIIMNNPPTPIYDEEHELQLAIQRSMEER